MNIISENVIQLNQLLSQPLPVAKPNSFYVNVNSYYDDFVSISKSLTDDEIRNYIDINGRKHIHQYFMDIAYKVAERSTCVKRKVGAIIVKDKKIVSCGYNGISAGITNCTENNCILKESGKCGKFPIHAEVNCCLFATPDERKGATMYITCQACSNCASVIVNSGITTVIYDQKHNPEVNILLEANITELQLLEAIRIDLYKRENFIRNQLSPKAI